MSARPHILLTAGSNEARTIFASTHCIPTPFNTSIWTDEVLQVRAKHYGLTVEQYKKNNVLKTEVTSRDAAEMCGPLFAKTTTAQVPVDGGNERVI